MVFVASKERSRLTQGSPPGELCLRVVGSARDGQVVRLTAAKCAIGSAEGCTLRLRARGVRPVHCLVLRGTNGTVARSWAPNTRINGETFRDAVLEAGDRLSIGPVEFEVLAAEGPSVDPTDAGRTVVLDRRPAHRSLPAGPAKPFARPKQPTRWRSHVRKLISEVRKLRSQIDDFQAAAQVVPQADRSETDDIREKLESYKQQNEQWETTLQGLQSELDSREGQLATELANLEAARKSLDTQRHEWQAEADSQRNDLADREQSHRQATDVLQAAQAAFAAEHCQHDAGLQAAREQLAHREAELQTLAQQQSETARQIEAMHHRSAELDERAHTLELRAAEIAEVTAASQRASEELADGRAAFEAQQVSAQTQLDEQRTVLEARECAHSETLAAHENRQRELESAHETLAERQAELEQLAAALSQERNAFQEDRQTREAELQSSAEELNRRAAELAERESQPAPLTTDQTQPAFETVVAQTAEFDVTEFTSRQAELAASEAAARQAAEELATARTQFEAQQAETLAEGERQARELTATRDEIDQRRSAVAEAESQLRTERESLFNERLSQEAELRQANEELQRRTATLAEREAQLAIEPTSPAGPVLDPAHAGELAERELRLAEQQAELDRERESLREDREEFDHTRLRSAERLSAEAKELELEREELLAAREAFETQRQLDFERDAEQDSEAESRTLAEEVSDNDYDHHDGEVDEEEDDEDEDDGEAEGDDEEDGQSLHEFAPARPTQRRQSLLETTRNEAGDTARAKPHGDEDVSIEDYMAALLNRSRSGQSVPIIQPAEPNRRNKRKSDVKPPTIAEKVESEEGLSPEVPVLDMPSLLVQLERRKQTEVRPDMNVLREIGITHARSAIATHGQQRSLRQAYGTLATSLVCFVAAFFVFYFGTHTVFHLTGMAIIVIGIYWLGTSIWAVNKVLTSMKQRRGGLRATLAEIDAEIEALKKEAEAELEEAK